MWVQYTFARDHVQDTFARNYAGGVYLLPRRSDMFYFMWFFKVGVIGLELILDHTH